jgi:thiamine-phosphate pyrophosphorylase
MSVKKARKKTGANFIIGGTANTLTDIQLHVKNGANYIGLGPFRFTDTKKKLSPVIGLEGYKNIATEMSRLRIHIPVVGVGGIRVSELDLIQKTGLYGAAISSNLLLKYLENN